jgi:hypothetical protein
MAIRANCGEEEALMWHVPSTAPGIFFNQPEPPSDNTLPGNQVPFRALKSAAGRPTSEPEGIKAFYFSDLGVLNPRSEKGLGNVVSRPKSQWTVAVVLTYPEAEKSTGVGEFDCLLRLGPVSIRPIEIECHYNQPAKEFSRITLSAASDYTAIRNALTRVRTTVAQEKVRAQDAAAQAIIRAGASAENVDRALQVLLSEHRSGRLDDAVDILKLLGREVVRTVFKNALSTYAPDGDNDDYWYVLIRAAGRTGVGDISRHFLRSPFLALEEAAVQALGDIGDAAALDDLRIIAKETGRPQLVRELAEELASDLA